MKGRGGASEGERGRKRRQAKATTWRPLSRVCCCSPTTRTRLPTNPPPRSCPHAPDPQKRGADAPPSPHLGPAPAARAAAPPQIPAPAPARQPPVPQIARRKALKAAGQSVAGRGALEPRELEAASTARRPSHHSAACRGSSRSRAASAGASRPRPTVCGARGAWRQREAEERPAPGPPPHWPRAPASPCSSSSAATAPARCPTNETRTGSAHCDTTTCAIGQACHAPSSLLRNSFPHLWLTQPPTRRGRSRQTVPG
jgi:hypothetical protein